jgi:uncharacterized protein (TIGR02246 family)
MSGAARLAAVFALLLLPLPVATDGTPAPGPLAAELQAELDRQAAAWNRGDLEGFAASYAEDAVFLSPSGLTRGRDAVLARYRQRYPTPAAMGTLALAVFDARRAPGTEPARLASAAARWTLTGPDREPASGLTLLVFEREPDGAWRVVQDASM